jgi:tRNA isopentenyl-2-thiomethyl-A-37 hydroxylase MiaE
MFEWLSQATSEDWVILGSFIGTVLAAAIVAAQGMLKGKAPQKAVLQTTVDNYCGADKLVALIREDLKEIKQDLDRLDERVIRLDERTRK